MILPPPTPPESRAFTLIELLVVMSIIAVLIGLLLPVVNSVTTHARKTQASSDEARIMTAVSSYAADYGKLPLNSKNNGYATVYGDPSGAAMFPSYMLFDVLRAIPEPGNYNDSNQLNPRQVVYFQGSNAKNPSDPKGGFLTADHNDGNYTMKTGSFVDPWGNEYMVWINGGTDPDLNGVVNPYFYTVPAVQGPPGPVQVSSLGADNEFGTKGNKIIAGSDDVVTWVQ